MPTKRDLAGFTLIEMMTVVAIFAIIVAIAYPNYVDYLVKSSRRAAQAFMMDVSAKEKEYLLDARSYLAIPGGGNTFADLGLALPTEVSDFYTVTVTVTNAPSGFTITATPIAGKRQAADGALALTNTGAKTGNW